MGFTARRRPAPARGCRCRTARAHCPPGQARSPAARAASARPSSPVRARSAGAVRRENSAGLPRRAPKHTRRTLHTGRGRIQQARHGARGQIGLVGHNERDKVALPQIERIQSGADGVGLAFFALRAVYRAHAACARAVQHRLIPRDHGQRAVVPRLDKGREHVQPVAVKRPCRPADRAACFPQSGGCSRPPDTGYASCLAVFDAPEHLFRRDGQLAVPHAGRVGDRVRNRGRGGVDDDFHRSTWRRTGRSAHSWTRIRRAACPCPAGSGFYTA